MLPWGFWARQLWSTVGICALHTGPVMHRKHSDFNLKLMRLSNEVGSRFTFELSHV